MLMEHHLHGLQPVILRASNPYGPRQGHGGVQGVIGTFLWQVAQREPIRIWGDGSIVRDFIHINDLCELCSICGDAKFTGVFNAGSGTGTSINDILRAIEFVTDRNIDVSYAPGRDFDVPRVVLESSSIIERTGWQARMPLTDGITDNWQWILERI